MKFPVVIIKEKEAPIYFFNSTSLGLVSKGGEKFYRKGTLYDSEGNKYLLDGIESTRSAPLLMSIKYFQPMKLVSIKHIQEGKVDLTEFKKLVIDHIKANKGYWTSRDSVENLEKSILQQDTFDKIIMFLQ